MSTSFPEHPSLENLGKRAKSILKAHRRKDPSVCDLLRRLKRFSAAAPQEILAADLKLSDVQFALAMAHGFESWTQLKQHVESQAAQPSQRPAQPSGLQLQGDGHRQDSCSLALCAVARLLGRPIDYETAFALSTNAYALGIVPGRGGECPAWWHMPGRHHGIDIIARRAGLIVERLDLPPVTEAVWTDPQVQLQRRCQFAPLIRLALGSGRFVVTSGGWDWKWQLPRLTPHCWWGVILEAQDDGTIRGACLNGREDNPIAILSNECWVVSPAAAQGDALEADIAMLDRTLSRIHANRDPFRRPDTIWEPVFGLEAMDVWIEQFRRVPFCSECLDRSHSCARSMARTVFEGARTVASYLGSRLDALPAAARPMLQSVAHRYAHMAGCMEPFTISDAQRGYGQIMGDAARQQQHIEQVLRPLRAELEAAAQDIAAALEVIQ